MPRLVVRFDDATWPWHREGQMVITAETSSVVRDASALARLLSEHAVQAEELRTMPQHVVEACAAAGMFKLALPKSLGGLECDPLTIVRVIEELSHADGSGGWTVMIGNTSAFTAWLEPEVARDIVSANPDAA